jgi:hypothetical protein
MKFNMYIKTMLFNVSFAHKKLRMKTLETGFLTSLTRLMFLSVNILIVKNYLNSVNINIFSHLVFIYMFIFL